MDGCNKNVIVTIQWFSFKLTFDVYGFRQLPLILPCLRSTSPSLSSFSLLRPFAQIRKCVFKPPQWPSARLFALRLVGCGFVPSWARPKSVKMVPIASLFGIKGWNWGG